MVSCDTNNYGCNGGYMDMAWEYIANHGIVKDSCFPYQAGSGFAPACRSSCVDGEPFKKYKCKAGSIRNPKSVEEIKSEIFTHGPVEGAFTVYEDFFSYSSGVYEHTWGGMSGGHAIKILGFGEENGTPYWLIANSWGPSWGINGLVKFKQGQCGIENQVFGCDPEL